MRGSPIAVAIHAPAKKQEVPVIIPKPSRKWIVFNCEMEQLEKELNERDPEAKSTICHIGHYGSSVRVVVKLP